jgi:homocysteine S-methyltransferase
MSSNLFENNPFETARHNSKPLILDGAMGSYLQQKGFATDDYLWTTNINHTDPDVIVQTHLEYIEAGADIITTNSFRTNPSALMKSGKSNFKKYVKQAVCLTVQASGGTNVLIAGSNAPAEDCYKQTRTLTNYELEINHQNHIDLLIDGGVHLILNETQSHLDEILIICQHCDKNSIKYVLSIYVNENLKLLSGETVQSAFSLISSYNPLAICFNCISPKVFLRCIGSISFPERWGFYLNCGNGHPTDKNIYCGIEPDEYLKSVEKALHFNPSFIGTCCGSSPAHTKKIREFLDGQNYS